MADAQMEDSAQSVQAAKVKGARRLRDVDACTRARLEAGGESRTHIEQMAIDFGQLARCVLPEDLAGDPGLRLGGFIQRMRAGGGLVWQRYGSRLFEVAPGWASDTCRGWAAFAIPLSGRPLVEQLTLAGKFAEDPHFAVREWAWLGVRPTVLGDPLTAVYELRAMAHNASERLRRFTSEVTRPRGVWSNHIQMFKERPELAIDLLNELAPDSSRYVSTSLGNWLNDAGRSRPEFVLAACAAWSAEYPLAFLRTRRLALRNLLDRAETS